MSKKNVCCIGSRRLMRSRMLALLGLGLVMCAWQGWAMAEDVKFFFLDDIEKPTKDALDIKSSPHIFDGNTVSLVGAKNEVVAFQLLLQSTAKLEHVHVEVAPFHSQVEPVCDLFYEHYHLIRMGNCSWGTGEGFLPWVNKFYPDALVPFYNPYSAEHEKIAQDFTLDPLGIGPTRGEPGQGPNQTVWIDVFIPENMPAGAFNSQISVKIGEAAARSFPLRLQVYDFALPNECHVDGFGELYQLGLDKDRFNEPRPTEAAFKDDPEKSWEIYKKYIQMGHAHRFLPLAREGGGPYPLSKDGRRDSWHRNAIWSNFEEWNKYYGQILDGSLFTPENGYVGPGVKTPPSFFIAPFAEGSLTGGGTNMTKYLDAGSGNISNLSVADKQYYTECAKAFWDNLKSKGWDKTRVFAYIFDECDGPKDVGEKAGDPRTQTDKIHGLMKEVQDAMDAGAGKDHINLLWTSHTPPSVWKGSPADLSDTIRWWSPNAGALDVDFFNELRQRKTNENVWFYHHGQPNIGNHIVNQTGIDLMTWGLMCWKYKINGSFWWSMMLFKVSRNRPYDFPLYKDADDRWGNGNLFYPAQKLGALNFKDFEGPIPSVRMKAYRRGLQDYEYLWLLANRQGNTTDADQLLDKVIRTGFSKADNHLKAGDWSQNPADWYKLRADVAAKILQSPAAAK